MLERGEPYTIAWESETGSIVYIDQTLLPGRYEVMRCTTVEDLARAIRRLEIRGAPALGIAGAMGVALAATRSTERDLDRFQEEICQAADLLRGTRPTAVNLGWGIDRVARAVATAGSVEEAKRRAVAEANAIAEEDEADLPDARHVRRRSRSCRLHGAYPLQCRSARLPVLGNSPRCDQVGGCGREERAGGRLRDQTPEPGIPAHLLGT